MLITIEGADGVGKSTLAAALVAEMRDIEPGLDAGLTDTSSCARLLKFPQYETATGRAISAYLEGDANAVPPMDAFRLYADDRLAAREQLCEIAHSQAPTVIDRYVDSNVAHQMARYGAPPAEQSLPHEMTQQLREMYRLEYVTNALPRPDVTIMLSCSSNAASSALKTRNVADHHEADADYQARVRAWYGWLMPCVQPRGQPPIRPHGWPIARRVLHADTGMEGLNGRVKPDEMARALIRWLAVVRFTSVSAIMQQHVLNVSNE